MVLKLSKKVHFLKLCANLSMKSKSIKSIYVYASERSRCAHLENGIVYYAMTATDLEECARGARPSLNFEQQNFFFAISINYYLGSICLKCNCQHVSLTSPPRRQKTPPPPTPPSF